MSRIDELIERLCPDGVEFRELKSVAKIVGGRDYKEFGEGEIPVYGSGGIMMIPPPMKGLLFFFPEKVLLATFSMLMALSGMWIPFSTLKSMSL